MENVKNLWDELAILFTLKHRCKNLPFFLQKKIQNNFADIKNICIFAMSRKTKPTGRVAGIKKIEL